MHLLAKQIIKKNNCIVICNNIIFNYSNAQEEQQLADFRPDILISNDEGVRWIVEIAVEHLCDEVKIKKIEAAAVNCVEIDLKNVPRDIDPTKLESLLLNESKWKKIHYPTPQKQNSDLLEWVLAGTLFLLAALGIRWLWRYFFK